MFIKEKLHYSSSTIFTLEVAELINRDLDSDQLIKEIINRLRQYCDIESVGLRLKRDGDYPYYHYDGLSKEFVKKEDFICPVDEGGDNLPACVCGKVLTGNIIKEYDLFTDLGSFKHNDLHLLVNNPDALKFLGPTRNECVYAGYRSMALIPIKVGRNSEIVGLLQLNDRRPGLFDDENIAFLEQFCSLIGIAFQNINEKPHITELISPYKAENILFNL